MNHQLKAGDLALVVGDTAFLGRQVELRKWVNPGDTFVDQTGAEVQLNPQAPVGGWLVFCGKQSAVKRQRTLMPLRGDFSREQQNIGERFQ